MTPARDASREHAAMRHILISTAFSFVGLHTGEGQIAGLPLERYSVACHVAATKWAVAEGLIILRRYSHAATGDAAALMMMKRR